jgi:hypothetical protein
MPTRWPNAACLARPLLAPIGLLASRLLRVLFLNCLRLNALLSTLLSLPRYTILLTPRCHSFLQSQDSLSFLRLLVFSTFTLPWLLQLFTSPSLPKTSLVGAQSAGRPSLGDAFQPPLTQDTGHQQTIESSLES